MKKHKFWKKLGIIASILTALGIIAFFAIVIYFSKDLPDISDPETHKSPLPTEIYDREGELLYTIHAGENRKLITFKDISPNLIKATIDMEDVNFWHHSGIDYKGLTKAMLYEIFEIGKKRGGSTITQQYVKNQILTPEVTYTRKIKEIILAKNLEHHFTKKEIFTMYINKIPYGNNSYGCEKASETYFNKNCKTLNLAESAILASIPQAPSYYNPYGNHKYIQLTKTIEKNTKEISITDKDYKKGLIGQGFILPNGTKIYIPGRADLVLERMLINGDIDTVENLIASKQLHEIEFQPYVESIKYPHFVFYIKEYLEDKYGKDFVEQGGLKVYTTLDPKIQDYSEKIIKEKTDINKYRFGANNTSSMTVNPQTGEILAMVGSIDYFNTEIDGNVNVATRPRQPGSSFKPIVYARAFYEGFAPGNTIYDIPTSFDKYRPQNYDGRFMGQMTIRRALAQSRNIPAVKAYFLAGEQEKIVEFAKILGITSLDKEHYYGPSLALGSGEVPLIEMVQAYSTFATNGKKSSITGIKKIINRNGKIIETLSPEQDPVLDPQIAYMINSILSDQRAGIGPNLYIPGQLNAAKTGTSTKQSKSKGYARPGDTWTLGYTPNLITGVWVGNTDGKGLGYLANGYDTAAPIMKKIMTEALKDTPKEPFPEPAEITHYWITRAYGSLSKSKTKKAKLYKTTDVYASFSKPPSTSGQYSIINNPNWKYSTQKYLQDLKDKKEKEEEEEEKKKAEESNISS